MGQQPAMPGWDELPEAEKDWWRAKRLETGTACVECGRPTEADPNDHSSEVVTCYHCRGCGAQVDVKGRWHACQEAP